MCKVTKSIQPRYAVLEFGVGCCICLSTPCCDVCRAILVAWESMAAVLQDKAASHNNSREPVSKAKNE